MLASLVQATTASITTNPTSNYLTCMPRPSHSFRILHVKGMTPMGQRKRGKHPRGRYPCDVCHFGGLLALPEPATSNVAFLDREGRRIVSEADIG